MIGSDPVFALMLQIALQSLGKDVVTRVVLHDAEEHEVARSFNPDLILLDLKNPLRGGAAIFVHLRSEPRLENTPVIIMSASITEMEAEGRSSHFVHTRFLAKPFRLSSLFALIAELL